jgi:hypothetical protein
LNNSLPGRPGGPAAQPDTKTANANTTTTRRNLATMLLLLIMSEMRYVFIGKPSAVGRLPFVNVRHFSTGAGSSDSET